jgi:anti-sigma28 factor (negative regulator of flagellin synthesis)
MSLTLERIPKPMTAAEIEAKKKAKDKADEEKRSQTGKPPIKLTDRQRKEASDKAKEYLKTNTKIWAPDIQSAIEKGNYKLATDADTGDVTMLDAKGKKLGVVLRSLGDKQQSANDKITTIPVKKDAKVPELKPEKSNAKA